MNPEQSRRGFIAVALSATSASRVMGANDRVRLGIIGTGSRGDLLMDWANRTGGIQWVAVCDAWDQRARKAADKAGAGVEVFGDYRRLLDRKDIDAVIVATWDNTHSQIGVDACTAGKDVYLEKPMTSMPTQGHPLVRAVRENKRILQVGVQQRSMAHFIEARQKFIDSGLLGRVHMVRTIWNSNPGYLWPVPPGMERKPEGLDWEACLGTLPKIPWDAKRYFNRYSYWDLCSGGQTGGLFVHMIDVVHWYLNLKKAGSAVASGGLYQFNDGRDTPDNINLILEYPEKVLVTFEATLSTWVNEKLSRAGGDDMWERLRELARNTGPHVGKLLETDIVFTGTGGRLSIFRHGYNFVPVDSGGRITQSAAGPSAESAHMANWLDCVRRRKEPNANVLDGHYSAMACHIGNIAYREKARVEWNPEWDV